MLKASISNQELFRITDEEKAYYGCDQNWYTTWWKRMAGCGPTTACNLLYYLENSRSGRGPDSRKALLTRMNEVWEYVTPTVGGVNKTSILYNGALACAKSKGMDIRYNVIDLPEDKACRPPFSEVLAFIEAAMSEDAPVGFLNLCNGEEKNLDSWHWVTIISIEYEEDGGTAKINILDEGIIKSIDLALWYNTTKKGGGFVYFSV